MHDLTLTGISKLDEKLRTELIGFIVEPPGVAHALSPLRLLDGLPSKEDWHRHLPLIEPSVDHLMGAVGKVLWHQSQGSTDCRWVRLMVKIFAGKMLFDSKLADLVHRLFEYPNEYSQVESRVRAAEISLNSSDPPDLTWPRAFWHELWVKTPCIRAGQRYKQPSFDEVVTYQDISELRNHLEIHWKNTHSTTAIDPKHDAVFGMAFYCLRILDEMMGIGIGIGVLGRLGLRTILEVRINLNYLLINDNPDLWEKWRDYGAGQAKLNALKFDDSVDPPKYIDIESIERIASEDMWEEFRTVNLASWSGLDLRKISEQSGLKYTYDQHYSWTSGYSHGMWGAVRESCYQMCENPLHRLHRYPARQSLQDTVDDVVMLIDEIIQHIDDTYPTFKWRLRAKSKT